MTDPVARPAPTPRGEERRYFDDLRERRLPVYRCAACATAQAHPFARCVVCGGSACEREWAAGTGTVYSFTELQTAGHPGLADRVPYSIALVDLDEGVRSLADLRVDVDSAAAAIGARVRVGFDDLPDGTVLPHFVVEPRR